MAEPDLIAALASYARSIALSDVPAVVRDQAKLCILDTLGATVAGSMTEDWKPLMAVETSDNCKAEARVVTSGVRLSAEAAARVNAFINQTPYEPAV